MKLAKILLLLLCLALPQQLLAQESDSQSQKSEKLTVPSNEDEYEDCEEGDTHPDCIDEDETAYGVKIPKHNFMLNYSLLDLWIPSKIGLSYAYQPTKAGAWEIEYLRGSLSVPFILSDLGGITEQRLTLMRRSHFGRSFSITYGVYYYDFAIELGDSLLSSVSGGDIPNVKLLKVSHYGAQFGLGNRWWFKKWMLSVDWLVINVPLVQGTKDTGYIDATSDPADRESVDDMVTLISNIPQFSSLKFQVGLSF